MNDNAPKFELPDYQAHNVDEDISLGTSILKVKATDADSGANAEIEYLVSDDHFSVDSSGLIVNNKQLDADNNNAYYEFIVTAKDKGTFLFCFADFHEICHERSFRRNVRPVFLFFFLFSFIDVEGVKTTLKVGVMSFCEISWKLLKIRFSV